MAFTFFFRDWPILQTAADMLAAETMGRSRVRVWDAGCAMGPEPYTFLILLAERMGRFAFKNMFIDATDHDEGGDFGATIEAGVYPAEQLQRMPPELFAKYFAPAEGRPGWFVIAPCLRERIRFRRHDLLSLSAPGEGYAMIICKNVLLHFEAEKRIEVIDMFHSALADNGLLVLEHTQKMPPECGELFEQAADNSSIYRRKAVVPVLVA